MPHDVTATNDRLLGSLQAGFQPNDNLEVCGRYEFVCSDADGNVLWTEVFDNLVTTVGKNLLLDQALAGSAYTAAEFMGLISSVSFSAVAAADTMASHAGWLEASSTNAPNYGTTRPTAAWSAASAGTKSLSAGLTFTFSNGGTVQGAFLVGGSGASATVANTSGTLISAGTLGTPQPVIATNVLTVTYSMTLT